MPHGNDHTERRSILQGVYEDNLGIENGVPIRPQRRTAAPPSRAERRLAVRSAGTTAWWRRGVAALLVLVLLAMAGAAYRWLPSTPRAASTLQAGGPPVLARSASSGASLDPPSGEAAPASTRGPVRAPGEDASASAQGALGAGASLASLFGLQVRTIVIDPGHGGEELGAIGPSGLREKRVALDVARRLRRRLEEREGYRILMTRAWDEHVPLRERVRFANENEADLFISIHVNWLPVEKVTSIETYYFGRGDEEGLQLAARENQESAYTVAEFSDMMERVGQTMRLQESKRLATSIQKSLYRNMRQDNKDVSDWGVKTAPFVVLLGTEAPSVLAEISVLSNRAEEAKLKTRAYRERLAMFLEEGIIGYLDGAAFFPEDEGALAAPPPTE